MKCPFLTKRKEIFDREGKRMAEELDIHDCIKNECMVYDGATKLCSLLSINIKNGILIDDLKNGIKELKEEIFQRSDSTSAIISTTIQTVQAAVLARFDLLKKQNEVIVLGFDRLSELVNNKTTEASTTLGNLDRTISLFKDNLLAITNGQTEKMLNSLTSLGTLLVNQENRLKSLEETGTQFIDSQARFFEEIRKDLAESSTKLEKTISNISNNFEALKSGLEKISTTNQIGMETILSEIGKSAPFFQEISNKIGLFENFSDSLKNIAELMKSEIAGLKSDGLGGLNSLANKLDELIKVSSEAQLHLTAKFEELIKGFNTNIEGVKSEVGGLKSESTAILGDLKTGLSQYAEAVKTEIVSMNNELKKAFVNIQLSINKSEELFSQTQRDLVDIKSMMTELNRNYLESLGKIAGLAEGMRKGVEKVGEEMQASAKELVKAMKEEIGALEDQYLKAFKDIAGLATKFEEVNDRLGMMTNEIQREFKEALERQTKLSDLTGNILQHIKDYFDKEDRRYKEEQIVRQKKGALDHFDRATLYYYRGNYELALNEIAKAIEMDKTAEYLNLKGLILSELGKADEAQEAYQEALRLEPNLAEIYNNLGLLYLKIERYDDAVSSFHEAVRRNANYGLAYVHLGKALGELERYDEAIAAFERALQIDPANRAAKEAIELYKEGKLA